MKIIVNYDLLERISEAKKGYSLSRCNRRTFSLLGISVGLTMMIDMASGIGFSNLISGIPIQFLIHASGTGVLALASSKLNQRMAIYDLIKLFIKLKQIQVRINVDALMNAYTYKTKYKLHKGKYFPNVEQIKYINLSYEDPYFGDGELSLKQEHTLGTKQYALSYGHPEEKKSFSFLKKAVRT